jgi:PKD repeat protein
VRCSLIVEAVDVDGEVNSYFIDLGDGNQTTFLSNASSHAYREAGTYEVEVVATDNLGATGSATVTIVILNRPPRAPVSLPYWYDEQSQAVVLDAFNSSDPEGGGLTYAWNFGDGATGSGPVANHTYGAPAVYLVTLTVTDKHGGTSNATVQVTVLPPRGASGDAIGFLMAAVLVFVIVITAMYLVTQRRLAQEEGVQSRKKVPGGRDPAAGQPRSEEE